MRPIDADALLAAYDAQHEGPPGKALKLIENAPTVTTAPAWISVKDRLPDVTGHYIVMRDNGFMAVDTFTNKSHWGKSVCHITHWMPLPEPPKEDDNV